MALHARQLTVLDPCDVFDPAQRVSHCAHCRKNVYDLSRMTEREVRRFLRRNEGRPVCVAYRTRTDGTLALRSSALPLGVVALAALVGGCMTHHDGYVTNWAGDLCYDLQGQEFDCKDRPGTAPEAGCPVIPHQTSDAKRTIVNFSVDPEASNTRLVGIVVPGYRRLYGSHHGHREPLDFQPTAELWADFAHRIRTRREDRKRSRARRRKR